MFVTHPLVLERQVTFPLLLPPLLITEGQVTFAILLPPPPDYGRTSYISPPATTPQSYISPHPIPDYGRKSYIKTILPFFALNLAPYF